MNLITWFSNITNIVKLISIIFCLFIGGLTIFKTTNFVNDYYTYKEVAQEKTKVVKEQAKQAEQIKASSTVTGIAENDKTVTDETIRMEHVKRLASVDKKIKAIKKENSGVVTESVTTNDVPEVEQVDAPIVVNPNEGLQDTSTQISNIYISSLWESYCVAAPNAFQCNLIYK